jgi:hypothetical protein
MSSEEVQVEKRVVFKGSEGVLSLTASTIRFKPNEFSESVDWSVGSITDVNVRSSSSGLIQMRLTFVRDKREQHVVFEFIGDSNEAAISDRTRFCSRLDAVRAAAGASTAKVPAVPRPSATLSSSQRAQLRADYLRDNPDKLMLFKQLVPNLVSETEYWKGALGWSELKVCVVVLISALVSFQRNKSLSTNMQRNVVHARVKLKNLCISKNYNPTLNRRRTVL